MAPFKFSDSEINKNRHFEKDLYGRDNRKTEEGRMLKSKFNKKKLK